MRRSAFAVQFPVKSQKEPDWKYRGNSQEIKVVENKKDSQKYIDNHTDQNYNVEHF